MARSVINPSDLNMLKQPGRFTSLNHNIYIAAYPTPVDVDHAAHAGELMMFTQRIMTMQNDCRQPSWHVL